MPSTNDFVPPTHDRRTLVLVFDGTGDQFDDDNSNMVRFFSMLKKDNRDQLVYYQSGIGTYTLPQIAKPYFSKFTKAIDSMIAKSLNAHVMGGYEFLMQNYREDDAICVFGFSRGAYTARALAGMIHKVGLLPMSNHQQVAFAYSMYARDDAHGWEQSVQFKRAFSIDVEIEFLGVWDTVGSVGIIPRRLPFTTSNTHVRTFRHAIALDERRSRFKPYFWNPPFPPNRRKQPPKPNPEAKRPNALGFVGGVLGEEKPSLREMEEQYQDLADGHQHSHHLQYTNVEEVWFAGCHCDVGGGSVPNATVNSLARIPLRWMIRQCFLAKTGIMFEKAQFEQIGMDWNTLHPTVKERPPMVRSLNNPPSSATESDSYHDNDKKASEDGGDSRPRINEEEEDYKDALCPLYDQLKISKVWWLLELLPMRQRVFLENKVEEHKRKKAGAGAAKSKKKLTFNLGRGRSIPRQQHGLKVHRTVQLRMEAAEAGLLRKPVSKKFASDGKVELTGKPYKYVPKAKWNVEPDWIP